MVKIITKKQHDNRFWFFVIWLGLITIILMSYIVLDSLSKYTYRTQIIELNNNNFGEELHVVDYICDEGLKVYNYQNPFQHYFYVSAWIDAKVHSGKCIIKIKEEKQ